MDLAALCSVQKRLEAALGDSDLLDTLDRLFAVRVRCETLGRHFRIGIGRDERDHPLVVTDDRADGGITRTCRGECVVDWARLDIDSRPTAVVEELRYRALPWIARADVDVEPMRDVLEHTPEPNILGVPAVRAPAPWHRRSAATGTDRSAARAIRSWEASDGRARQSGEG